MDKIIKEFIEQGHEVTFCVSYEGMYSFKIDGEEYTMGESFKEIEENILYNLIGETY